MFLVSLSGQYVCDWCGKRMDRFARVHGHSLCDECYNRDRVKRREIADRRRRNRPELSDFVRRHMKEWKEDEMEEVE